MKNIIYRVREILSRIEKGGIIITDYAKRNAGRRQINLSDVYDDLLHPARLTKAEIQYVDGEERFKCYFVHSKGLLLRYILTFENGKVKVINLIKERRRWRKRP